MHLDVIRFEVTDLMPNSTAFHANTSF